jgi:hypothetical protein
MLMKDETGRILSMNCPIEISVFGMLVGGKSKYMLKIDSCVNEMLYFDKVTK